MPTVTYKVRELVNNRLFGVRGTGATRAAALAEANAKLLLTVGVVESNSASDVLTPGEVGGPSGGSVYSDAELILRRTSDGKKIGIHLENIDCELGTGTNGQIDVTNANIIAFAAAYRDGEGAGGYAIYDGYFTR